MDFTLDVRTSYCQPNPTFNFGRTSTLGINDMANKKLNTQLDAELAGTSVIGDYATPATNALKIQALLDLIEPEQAENFYRGLLDEMSPMARNQLIVELRALKDEAIDV